MRAAATRKDRTIDAEPETTRDAGHLTDDLYRLVGLDPPRYRRRDIERLSGVGHERSVKWWRAMGFPEVPEDVAAFGEIDVEMVRRLGSLDRSTTGDDEEILRLARVLGASLSRIAEAQVALLDQLIGGRPGEAPPSPSIDELDPKIVSLLADTTLYAWRRQLLAAVGRRMGTGTDATDAAVGFADLVEFTKLAQRLAPAQLADLVDDFERVAFDVVSALGGRTVKLVGDEVMFVTGSFAQCVDIGLELARRLREVPGMPEIHCGIAFGPIVAVGGDVFGPAANLAARLTTIARPGTIVVPAEAARELDLPPSVDVVPAPRRAQLKGIGATDIVALCRVAD